MALEKSKGYILIVDDEKGLRQGTKRLLEIEGHTVETAENGNDGIELGSTKDFDIAIIDLKMPDIDGIEVLNAIKKAKPNTVCFIATAFASYETAIESTRIGAYGYIPKPFSPEELITQVEKGLNQRRLIIEAEILRHEREERLLELSSEKSRLSTIINTINNGVLVVNKAGEVVYFNSATLKYLDMNEITIGEYVLDHLPEKISTMVKEILQSDVQKRASAEVEIKPNKELVIEAFLSRVPHADGSLAGVIIATRNITDFKKIELVKNQFVSMVAHELKTPVAAVLGFLRIILDESLNVTVEQRTDFLQRSVLRLTGLLDLVNDLLDMSRMELGTKQREFVDFDVVEILKSIIIFLEMELDKKGITVNISNEENIPILKADQGEINRLFTNIISNAIKYNKENGKIDIVITKSKNYVVTKISDSGIGLKPEEKEKLFQQFFRAKNAKTKNISGTGLGLSIVKQIVESYAGKIEVDSEFGVGTTFTIYLPFNK